jgi:hypothetical protein
MDEYDNLTNIDRSPSSDTSVLKRKLDGSTDELTFPCKRVAVSPAEKTTILDVSTLDVTTTPTKSGLTPVKLNKAEREWLKTEKIKEREMERQKREAEKLKREEERVKREEKRLKKVATNVKNTLMSSKQSEMK